MVSVTGVVPAVAPIDAGLKTQLVKAGRFAQARVTAALKVPAPTGAAEKV
jgi:hypothetical protein